MAYGNNSYNRSSNWGQGFAGPQFPNSNTSQGSYRRYNNQYRNNAAYHGAKKRSGAKFVRSKDGKGEFVSAWRYDRRLGMVTVFITETKFTAEKPNGNTNYMAIVNIRSQMREIKCTAICSAKNGKYYLPKYGLVINPKAPNGGYFGTAKVRK